MCLAFWRRRRDSNPRDPFGAYTISNRARSTKLRDFSVFALANLVAGDATLAIIAGLLGMSREKWKKDVTFYRRPAQGKLGRKEWSVTDKIVIADGTDVGPALIRPRDYAGDVEVKTVFGFPHAIQTEFAATTLSSSGVRRWSRFPPERTDQGQR